MQPNSPAPTPAPQNNASRPPQPTTDNVAPVGPVLVDNVPIVQQAAVPPSPGQAAQMVPAPISPPVAPQPHPDQHAKLQTPAKAKPHKASQSKPWLVIFAALIVALALAALAFKAYQS
jgi:hypothetical protein